MDWSELARTTCWTPLVRVCKDAVPIAEWLYQIDSNQYVLALPTNSASQKGLPDAPFVTLGYWAETSEAIQRVVLGDDTKQVPNVRHPPLDLQLGTNGTYGALHNAIALAPPPLTRPPFKHASYSMKTGMFMYKTLSNLKFEYLFLETSECGDELPFAIAIRLAQDVASAQSECANPSTFQIAF